MDFPEHAFHISSLITIKMMAKSLSQPGGHSPEYCTLQIKYVALWYLLQAVSIRAADCRRAGPQHAWCPLTTQYVMTLSTSAGGGKIGSFLLLSYIQ